MGTSSTRKTFGDLLDLIAKEYGKDPFWVLSLDLDQFNRIIEIIGKRLIDERVKFLQDTRMAMVSIYNKDALDSFNDFINQLQGNDSSWSDNELKGMGFGING